MMKSPSYVALVILSLTVALGNIILAADDKREPTTQPPAVTGRAITAQELWSRINTEAQALGKSVTARRHKEIHPRTKSIAALIHSLPEPTPTVAPEKQAQIAVEIGRVDKALENLNIATDNGQQIEARAKYTALSEVMAALKLHYTETSQSGLGPVKGAAYDDAASTQAVAQKPSMKAEVVAQGTVRAGQEVLTLLRLTRPDGKPVLFSDLAEVQTKKIHVLVIDQTAGDFRHETPTETATPGEFAFTFRPRKSGKYTIWAGLLPLATGKHEYIPIEVAVPGEPEPLNQVPNLTAEVDGYHFTLSNQEGLPFRAGESMLMTVSITKPNGSPADNLEPLLGAFAHGVGFTDDLRKVLHVRTMDEAPKNETERGGPLMHFHLIPAQTGFLKFYVQVVVDGKQRVAGFGLQVKEGNTPPKLENSSPPIVATDYQFLAQYEEIRAALAADDLLAAQKSAHQLVQAAAVAQSKTIDEARDAFKLLSSEAVKLAAGKRGFYVMRCPVVTDGNWVQTSNAIANPYMGKRMLSCGSIIYDSQSPTPKL